MLYRAEGFVERPKPWKRERFTIKIERNGPGLEIVAKTQRGFELITCTSYQYCRDIREAQYYLASHLIGRNKNSQSKVIVTRQTKGRNWL